MTGPYDDMLHLPQPIPATRPRMPMEKRAAQFLSFAALTGFESGIKESARLTDRRIKLGEDAIEKINRQLCILAERIAENPKITVTYFQPDEAKGGGAYVSVTGALKKMDAHEKIIVLMDGRTIAVKDVLRIESALFAEVD